MTGIDGVDDVDLTSAWLSAMNLIPSPDGVWRCQDDPAGPARLSYPHDANDACFGVEDTSFWFRHRNACILQGLAEFPPAGRLLDVGGGNGFVARALQDAGYRVVLIEPGIHGAHNAVSRGVHHVVCSTLDRVRFPTGEIAGCGLFDVLEHIEDDRGFLAGIHDLLAIGSRLYLTVPAYPRLWSHEDVAAGHYRRYTRSALLGVLRHAGFAIEYFTGIFGFLLPPIALFRTLPWRFGIPSGSESLGQNLRREHEATNPLFRRILLRLLTHETRRIAARRQARFGASWLVVAAKTPSRPWR